MTDQGGPRPGTADERGTGPTGRLALAVIVVLLVAVALSLALFGVRVGVLVLVGGLVLAGGCRLLLPVSVVGPLAVRSRGLDVATCWALAVALLVILQLVPLP